MPGEESDESSRETCSDGSSDCETGFSESTLQGMKGLSLRYKPFNGSSSDEGDFSSSPGVLIFEYFEHAPPFSREPLADKVISSSQFFYSFPFLYPCILIKFNVILHRYHFLHHNTRD